VYRVVLVGGEVVEILARCVETAGSDSGGAKGVPELEEVSIAIDAGVVSLEVTGSDGGAAREVEGRVSRGVKETEVVVDGRGILEGMWEVFLGGEGESGSMSVSSVLFVLFVFVLLSWSRVERIEKEL
jgi:hypothetical protein